MRTGSTNELNGLWGTGGSVSAGTSVFGLDRWVHVALVKNGNNLTIYVNGTLKGNVTTVGTTAGTANAFIGGLTVTTQEMNGKIDDVAVWNRSLTAGEINDLYNSGSGLYLVPTNTFPSSGTLISNSLQGLWLLNEGTGTSTADDSGNARTGTLLQNTTWVDGKVIAPTIDTSALVWSSQDGTNNLEQGIQTFGDSIGRTVIDGRTLRFNIQGVEEMQMDGSGNLILPGNFELQGNQLIDTASLVGTNGLYFDGSNVDSETERKLGIRGITAGTNSYLDFQSAQGSILQVGVIGNLNRAALAFGAFSTRDNTDFMFGTGEDVQLRYGTAQTPDSFLLGLGADSLSMSIVEKADVLFDFAHPLQLNPTMFIHSSNQNTTQWLSLTHNATVGIISTGAGNLVLNPAGNVAILNLQGGTDGCSVKWNSTTGILYC